MIKNYINLKTFKYYEYFPKHVQNTLKYFLQHLGCDQRCIPLHYKYIPISY